MAACNARTRDNSACKVASAVAGVLSDDDEGAGGVGSVLRIFA